MRLWDGCAPLPEDSNGCTCPTQSTGRGWLGGKTISGQLLWPERACPEAAARDQAAKNAEQPENVSKSWATFRSWPLLRDEHNASTLRREIVSRQIQNYAGALFPQ